MIVAYGLVIRKIKTSGRKLQRSTNNSIILNRSSSEKNSTTNRVLLTSIILVSTFAACWAPLHIYRLARIKGIYFSFEEVC